MCLVDDDVHGEGVCERVSLDLLFGEGVCDVRRSLAMEVPRFSYIRDSRLKPQCKQQARLEDPDPAINWR